MTALLDIAVRAAREAGAIITSSAGKLSPHEIDRKQASDYVTRVDRESEARIVGIIREAYSEHIFLAEETRRDQPARGKYRWIIDPLDGTTNYIHGLPVYAVSIALEHEGEVVLGVVYDPTRDEMFTARKGQGAYMNGARLSASAQADAGMCLLATGFPFKMREHLDSHMQAFRRIFMKVSDIRRAGAAALDLANVAAGRLDGFFELGLAPWDIAAGSLLIEEAGGVITDFGGGGAYLETGNVVAGNSMTNAMMLGEIQPVFKGILEA